MVAHNFTTGQTYKEWIARREAELLQSEEWAGWTAGEGEENERAKDGRLFFGYVSPREQAEAEYAQKCEAESGRFDGIVHIGWGGLPKNAAETSIVVRSGLDDNRDFLEYVATRGKKDVLKRRPILLSARSAGRSPRRAGSRTNRTKAADGKSDDDGSGDSPGDPDNPASYHKTKQFSPVTFHPKGNKHRYLNRRLSRRSWRVSRNTYGTQRKGR